MLARYPVVPPAFQDQAASLAPAAAPYLLCKKTNDQDDLPPLGPAPPAGGSILLGCPGPKGNRDLSGSCSWGLPVARILCDSLPMRTIRRYSNRKLYDTQDSHYVNLQQIADLIRGGEEIRVIHKTSQRDLTAATFCQIIFEETKRGPQLPVAGLRKIIVSGLPVE